MRQTLQFLAPFVLLAGLACAAAPSGQPKVAVLDFKSKGILDQSGLRLMQERIAVVAGQNTSVQVLDVPTTRKLLFDGNVLVPNKCDAECLKRLGSKLDVQYLVLPTVEKEGDRMQLKFQLAQTLDGQVIKESSTWVDGRVGFAVEAGMRELLNGFSPKMVETGIPSHAKTAAIAGVLATTALVIVVLSAPEEKVAQDNVLQDSWELP